MEIHRAPGPPRVAVVVVDGVRSAVLEVAPGRDAGAVRFADRTAWSVERPPGSGEWWFHADDGQALATCTRTALVRERFRVELPDLAVELRRVSSLWRRRWDVTDAQGRVLVEVAQRPLSRTIHDVRRRSGDVPAELPYLTAWLVALVTTDPEPRTTRRRLVAGPR